MLDDPSPCERDRDPTSANLSRYAVLQMLLAHAFHCAEISISEVDEHLWGGILGTRPVQSEIKPPCNSQGKRYHSAVLLLRMKQWLIVCTPITKTHTMHIQIGLAGVRPT